MKLKKIIISAALLLTAGLFLAPSALAADCSGKTGKALTTCLDGKNKINNADNGLDKGVQAGESGNTNSLPDIIKTVINVALFIIGALSVIMLIYGGIRYTTSAGDSSKITSAKHTIMYAIIGLVVALLAYAIVNFVVTNISK
ncbi:MAG: pilin [Candidatus Nomurabacteria bacterium]|nr:pilin [Candidatus Nomurabacteria bacterium]